MVSFLLPFVSTNIILSRECFMNRYGPGPPRKQGYLFNDIRPLAINVIAIDDTRISEIRALVPILVMSLRSTDFSTDPKLQVS